MLHPFTPANRGFSLIFIDCVFFSLLYESILSTYGNSALPMFYRDWITWQDNMYVYTGETDSSKIWRTTFFFVKHWFFWLTINHKKMSYLSIYISYTYLCILSFSISLSLSVFPDSHSIDLILLASLILSFPPSPRHDFFLF